MKKLIINGDVFINDKWQKVNLLIEDEKIAYIGEERKEADEVIDANGMKIIPGLIDPHVHFSLNCGTVTSRDDFISGTKCAALGGVTTIIDFLDPTRNARKLERSFYDRLSLAKTSQVDYHMHACIKEPDADLEQYVLQMKALGMNTIKLFTTYSETRRRTYDQDIIELLRLSKKYNFLVCCHVENDEMVNLKEEYKCTDIAIARPSESETTEVLKLAKFAVETGGNLYIVHLSSGETLRLLIEQFKEYLGKNIFLESCPQYFYFNKDVLQSDKGFLFTFAPPLRSEKEQKLLQENIQYINTIGTDHCSFTYEDKKSHPMLIGHPLGIGGVETSFLVLHKMFGDQIINKMSKNVANLECFPQKGEISIGKDADLVFLKECEKYKIGKPHGNVDYSIYEGIEVNEKIVHTMLRGEFVVKDEKFIAHQGELINCPKEEKPHA